MAIQVAVGLSVEKDYIQAAKEATLAALRKLQSKKIDLAFVFSSADLAYHALLKTVSGLLENTIIIGASGPAIICDQGIFKHGLAIMLLSFPEGIHFNAACVKDTKIKTAFNAGGELAEKLLYGFKGIRRDLGVIISNGLIEDGANLIIGLQEKLGRSFPLIGAWTSDTLGLLKTYLYFNQDIFNDGAAGILWGGKLSFGLGIKHGWKPLGKPRYVTESRGNIVYRIDGAPAAQVYEEYLACDAEELKRGLKRISVFYPIGMYLPGEEEYLLRSMVSIQEEGALVFQGDVPENSQIRLMIGNKESCLAATEQALYEARRELPRPNFVLVFDSISRYILLGRDASKELTLIKKSVGANVPVIGIYTYGEQAPLRAIDYQGRAYFHNQTVSILAVGG
jgi:hypothetical protein